MGGDDADDANDVDDAADPEGERVPTIDWAYWSDMGARTGTFEASLPIFEENVNELGVDVNIMPVTLAFTGDAIRNDYREYHIEFVDMSLGPDRLDPEEFLTRFIVNYAGDSGVGNRSDYMSCDYSMNVLAQARAGDPDERREYVNEASRIFSEDVANIPISHMMVLSGLRTDQLQLDGDLGLAGLNVGHPGTITQLRAEGEERIRYNGDARFAESLINNVLQVSTTPIAAWNNLVYSPLVGYDENYEIEYVLAESIDVLDDGLVYDITLRDATFHDGTPITSEDVAWTLDFIESNNDAYTVASSVPYESFEIINDQQLEIHLGSVAPFLLPRELPKWGILPRDVWLDAGAEEDPENVDLELPLVGSGPYQLVEFQRDEFMRMDPFTDHPVYTPELPMDAIVYTETSAVVTDFEAGNLNVVYELPTEQALEYQDSDWAEIHTQEGFTPIYNAPLMSFGPFQFRDFRLAFSQALDRERAIETALHGLTNAEVHASMMPSTHPWFAGDDILMRCADSPSSNIDVARDLLEENGWEWDSDGNLHYPPDYDTGPALPQGDTPVDHPDQFPCVTEIEEQLDS
ncbi:ABC transporter substrate-binding protein [Natronorarus salvus]|uniref:ABC transporter substrate-binding protein n=1 Tax=Natronorarus salvus TaxID=3117733 RepID=UPI002F2616DA